jgi:Pyruvate/2-oxoacid:ferredoxin oxidoreductase delta subunit
MPGGYPELKSGLELRILEKLFTPEEAELTMRLRLFPEPPEVIARRCAMEEAETSQTLASMARKGLILNVFAGEQVFYQATQFILGIYEYHVDSIDREFAEMMEEFLEETAETSLHKNALQQFRVVPVNASISSTSTVTSYDQAIRLVSEQKLAAVHPCICRKEKLLLGYDCEKPHESCLTFGVGAQYIINNGKGREISIDQALGYLKQADENAQVLMPSNSREIINMCCCCGCCCGLLRMLKMEDRPADHVRSAFQAEIDPARCASCETCLDRCQVAAIVENENVMKVDLARCIGCGLCVSTCPEEAASLLPRLSAADVPLNYFHMLSGLAKDRGLGFGKLSPMMKMTKLPLFLKMLPYLYKSGLGKPMVNEMAKRGWV